MPTALLVFVRVHWGWSIRIPYASIGGRSYLLPPPTTLLGMLAEHYAIRNLLPETGVVTGTKTLVPVPALQKLSGVVVNASAGLLEGSVIRATDVTRVNNVPYLKKRHQEDPGQWFGLSGFGVTLAPNALLAIAYILKSRDGSSLIEAAWSASRLGSKEGIVSVEYAAATEAREVRGKGIIRTAFYLQRDAYPSCRFPPGLTTEEMPTLQQGVGASYKHAIYVLPLREKFPDVYEPNPIFMRCKEATWYEIDVSTLPRRMLHLLSSINIVENDHIYVAL